MPDPYKVEGSPLSATPTGSQPLFIGRISWPISRPAADSVAGPLPDSVAVFHDRRELIYSSNAGGQSAASTQPERLTASAGRYYGWPDGSGWRSRHVQRLFHSANAPRPNCSAALRRAFPANTAAATAFFTPGSATVSASGLFPYRPGASTDSHAEPMQLGDDADPGAVSGSGLL
eukprot:jgi/Ulvmu1/1696/UM116_0008.1